MPAKRRGIIVEIIGKSLSFVEICYISRIRGDLQRSSAFPLLRCKKL